MMVAAPCPHPLIDIRTLCGLGALPLVGNSIRADGDPKTRPGEISEPQALDPPSPPLDRFAAQVPNCSLSFRTSFRPSRFERALMDRSPLPEVLQGMEAF